MGTVRRCKTVLSKARQESQYYKFCAEAFGRTPDACIPGAPSPSPECTSGSRLRWCTDRSVQGSKATCDDDAPEDLLHAAWIIAQKKRWSEGNHIRSPISSTAKHTQTRTHKMQTQYNHAHSHVEYNHTQTCTHPYMHTSLHMQAHFSTGI